MLWCATFHFNAEKIATPQRPINNYLIKLSAVALLFAPISNEYNYVDIRIGFLIWIEEDVAVLDFM